MSTLPKETHSASQAYNTMAKFFTGGDKNNGKSIKLPAKVREQGAAAKNRNLVIVVRERVLAFCDQKFLSDINDISHAASIIDTFN